MTFRPLPPVPNGVTRSKLDDRYRTALSSPHSTRAVQRAGEALADLERDPDSYFTMPWESLNALLGPMDQGTLVFAAAATGQGKTTFALSLTNRLIDAGRVVYYLGLEQEDLTLHKKLACMRAGVAPAIALVNQWAKLAHGERLRERYAAEVEALGSGDLANRLAFYTERTIDAKRIQAAYEEAHDFKAEIVIVDHIDMIEAGPNTTIPHELQATVRKCKLLAERCNVVSLVFSQINRDGVKTDRLATFRPPQLYHMQGSSSKEQMADIVFGIHRPIRRKRSNESDDEYRNALSAARAGALDISDVLEPETTAIVCMKHRIDGESMGKSIRLRHTHGRIEELTPEQEAAERAAKHGIRTSSAL